MGGTCLCGPKEVEATDSGLYGLGNCLPFAVIPAGIFVVLVRLCTFPPHLVSKKTCPEASGSFQNDALNIFRVGFDWDAPGIEGDVINIINRLVTK